MLGLIGGLKLGNLAESLIDLMLVLVGGAEYGDSSACFGNRQRTDELQEGHDKLLHSNLGEGNEASK